MTDGHCFISYSNTDGLDFATKLADELQGRHPNIHVWFDKREMDASIVDWDDQLANAIKDCKCLVFVMTPDSTAKGSTCKEEWTWALKYKKPVICLMKDKKAEVPFRLNNRQYIDISTDFDSGIALLRTAIGRLDEPEGILEELDRRLSQAKRDLQRTPHEEEKPRIQAEIEELNKQIEAQQKIVANPQAAQEQTQKNIEAGLEREREPVKSVAAKTSTKFINQPPGVAQSYFQDREMETEQVILFLKNEAQRVLTVVGRGGAGKTAMVCRLLKHIENGTLPDDFERRHGRVDVDGIVYLSEAGSRKVNFANLFEDLCKLLPAASAEKLSALYREPQTSTESKTVQLLAAFQGLKQVIVLLDNFENVVDAEKGQVKDAELDEALRAFLHAPHHPVKIIITTRVSARELDTFEPARQRLLPLDTGLQPEYAREALILMDEGNLVGIKNAGAELLNLAVARTRGLPRALEALYAALRIDRFTTLQELLDLPILPEKVVQAYVGEAFNRLDTNAQKVMQALAVYNRPVTPAAVDYLLAPHLHAIDSAPILQRLANMHFARKESGRFYLHPVDREFAFGLIENRDWRLEISDSDESQQTDYQSPITNPQSPFTQHDLTVRAADFFAAARKPRAEWKKLDDLSAQLAEFDLRCAAGDYDTAASVLTDFDGEYLLLWGHYRLIIDLHEKLQGEIVDKELARVSAGNLGHANNRIGKFKEAIQYYQNVLNLAKQESDKQHESTALDSLGGIYADLGDFRKAIEHHEQGLVIARESGDRTGEANGFINLGRAYAELGEIKKPIEYFEKALAISHEINYHMAEGVIFSGLGGLTLRLGDYEKSILYFNQALDNARENGNIYGESKRLSGLAGALIEKDDLQSAIKYLLESIQIGKQISSLEICSESSCALVQAYLLQNDLVNARATIEAALQYDVPENNHNASALHGIIALRQGDEVAARGAFVRAIGQADEILSKTAEYYSALDAKGLSICGLVLCRGAVPAPEDDGANTGRGDPAPTVDDAIETFRKARKIAPHAGVVKSVLRLFDELAKCDTEGILKGVRDAAEGKTADEQ
jgi:tetratricopeptide (TPR) repeat protein